LAAESGILLEHYIFLRLQAQGPGKSDPQDETAMQLVEEAAAVWDRVEEKLGVFASIVNSFDADSEPGRLLERDLGCKQRILASISRLWDETSIMDCIRTLLNAWTMCLWIDPMQVTIETLNAHPSSSSRRNSTTTTASQALWKQAEPETNRTGDVPLPPLWQYLVQDNKSAGCPPKQNSS
jgi:hypothetical protein